MRTSLVLLVLVHALIGCVIVTERPADSAPPPSPPAPPPPAPVAAAPPASADLNARDAGPPAGEKTLVPAPDGN